MKTFLFDDTPQLTQRTNDALWLQSVRDSVSLTLFVALSFSGFALVQLIGLG